MPEARTLVEEKIRALGMQYSLFLPATGRDAHETDIARTGAITPVHGALLRLCSPGSTLLDIGSNIGAVTIPLALRGVKVIAYDPLATNVEALTLAIAANGLSDRVTLRHAAAWNKPATLNFNPIGSLATLTPMGGEAVQAVDLDSDIPADVPISTIKIDIDGSEFWALQGLQKRLAKTKPPVVFELFPLGLRKFGSAPGDLIRYLKSFGYRIFRTHAEALVPFDGPPEQLVTDCLATVLDDASLQRLGFAIRPLNEGGIAAELMVQDQQTDLHRQYSLAVTDYLPPAVAENADIEALMLGWAREYSGNSTVSQFRADLCDVYGPAPYEGRLAGKLTRWGSVSQARAWTNSAGPQQPVSPENATPAATRRVWLDCTDTFDYLRRTSSVTGIQRICTQIIASLIDRNAPVQLCAYDAGDHRFKRLNEYAFLRAWHEQQKLRPVIEEKPRRLRRTWQLRIRKSAISLVPRPIRRRFETPPPQSPTPPAPALRALELRPFEFMPGDVLVHLGAFWHTHEHMQVMLATCFAHDIRFAFLCCDLIPHRHPEWFAPAYRHSWAERLRLGLSRADVIFTISNHAADDLRKFAAEKNIECPPIEVLRLGDDLPFVPAASESPPSDGRFDRLGGNFVLSVSTLDARKNQDAPIRAWKQLHGQLGTRHTSSGPGGQARRRG